MRNELAFLLAETTVAETETAGGAAACNVGRGHTCAAVSASEGRRGKDIFYRMLTTMRCLLRYADRVRPLRLSIPHVVIDRILALRIEHGGFELQQG